MAYTKYSLTPANNNATPPDGAPEGMLPSAVNDTMRDMMAQIRDVGDGIRNGTYTMTAPVITGGSITGVALSGNTFTNPVITGGSINNTPIGASTANSGAFTTLSASGVATFSAGTVSAPALTTTGDTNTGIFFPAADTIAFTEGGAESMRIDSSGNVGIGTSSPSYKLDVNGVSRVAGLRQTFETNLYTVDGALSNYSATNGVYLNGNAAGWLRLNGDGTNASYVQVIGASAGTAPNTVQFVTASSERMRIDSSGNVGIGTSSPDRTLSVYGNSTDLIGGYYENNNASGSSGADKRLALGMGGSSAFGITGWQNAGVVEGTSTGGLWLGAYNGDIKFGAASSARTERMRIDSSGYVSINRTSAYGNSYLNIQYSSTSQYGIIIGNTSTTFNGAFIEFRNSAGNSCGSIVQNGTTTVSYSTSSDYRLKENVAPMTGALEKVAQLKPVTYTWKADGSAGQGFIAHELQAVVPDCVTGEKDAVETYTDKDGVEQTRIKPQGIDTSFLVATLTAAIQEQQAQIEELKQEVAALKAK